MFVTLAGAYPLPEPVVPKGGPPTPIGEGAEVLTGQRPDADAAVARVIAELEAIGLEPLSDGEARWLDPAAAIVAGLTGLVLESAEATAAPTAPAPAVPSSPQIRAVALPAWNAHVLVDGWRYAAGLTTRAVKQALPGPYTLGRRIDAGSLSRRRVTLALAEALNTELRALAEAGCPLVEVQEDAAALIGESDTERTLFVTSQQRLLEGLPEGLHRTLAIRGGSAHLAGASTVFAPAYQSYLFDLIGGPDNWKLIAVAPVDRGIVCGAMDVRPGRSMGVEELIYAARYAASTRGRGLVRVGLAPAGSMAHLGHADARSRLETVVRAAELAVSSPEEIGRAIDPRAADIRSAALGRYAPGRPAPLGMVSPDVRKPSPAQPGSPSPDDPTGGPPGSPADRKGSGRSDKGSLT